MQLPAAAFADDTGYLMLGMHKMTGEYRAKCSGTDDREMHTGDSAP